MERLDDAAVARALENLPEWSREGDALVREFRFKNFREAMAFVNKIAEVAEELRHHPDITIRYNRVWLRLSTHEVNGLTQRDIDLAQRITKQVSPSTAG